ncbi:MAG: glycosyltransferase family 4 protein [Proteobacteria bacterium]|nr:glycosyltransferase family 4 protein [Pseudomonadota bacterium]
MRIMHIESGRHLYGGARQVCYLIDGLVAEGMENMLVCARGSEIAGAVRCATVVELPIGGDLDVFWAGSLRKLIQAHAPDIVHVHSRRGADLVGGRCARRAGTPAVLTRRVDSREPAWWARLKYRPYSAVAAISSALESELVDHVGLDPGRVVRVASAVDTRRYRPQSSARARLAETFRIPSNSRILGVIAQLIPRKGHALLLGCLPDLIAHHSEIRILFFGRGPLERALRRQIAARSLENRVQLTGFRDDLAELLPGLDLLVHPALREGLGVAVLEAMSAGVPVVASDAGGIPDIVEHERNGLRFATGDPSGLRNGVLRLLGDDALRRSLALAGRERVETEFSIRSMSRRYVEVYNRVLNA